MSRVEHALECDDDGELTLVTTTKLGHVAKVDPELIPESAWDSYVAFLDEDAEGQRAALEYEATADDAFNARFGGFGGRRA